MALDPYAFPGFRYTVWQSLSASETTLATTIGYTETTWDTPGMAAFEDTAFSDLESRQQTAFDSLGLFEERYDCWINHFNGYDWVDLEEGGFDEPFIVLGWDAESWENGQAPASDDEFWADLTPAQQQAAEDICYFQETWDEESLPYRSLNLPIEEVIAQNFNLRLFEAYTLMANKDTILPTRPLTLFSPWDGAFAGLDAGLVTKLRNRAWRAHLQDILLGHVYDGDLLVNDLEETQDISVLNQRQITVTRRTGTTRINVDGILVLATFEASDGVLYMLEQIILPPSPSWLDQNLRQIAQGLAPVFTARIVSAGLADELVDPDADLTLFAPENGAFADPAVAMYFAGGGAELLEDTLKYHMVISPLPNGPYPSSLFVPLTLTTLYTEAPLQIGIPSGGDPTLTGTVNQATIIESDYLAFNGLVHVIDTVLFIE